MCVCVCVHVCVCVVYNNKLIQKSRFFFMRMLCVCAHVCAGAHGDRHWRPRDEVPCSYEPRMRVQVTELGSSAKSVHALNQ